VRRRGRPIETEGPGGAQSQRGHIVEMQWSQRLQPANYYYYWFCQIPCRCASTVRRRGEQTDYNIFSSTWRRRRQADNSYQARLVMRDLPPTRRSPQCAGEGCPRLVHAHLQSSVLRCSPSPARSGRRSARITRGFPPADQTRQEIKDQAVQVDSGREIDAEKLQRLYDSASRKSATRATLTAPTAEEKKRLKDDDKQSPTRPEAEAAIRTHQRTLCLAGRCRRIRGAARPLRQPQQHAQCAESKGWLFVDDDIVLVKIGDRWQPYIPAITTRPPA